MTQFSGLFDHYHGTGHSFIQKGNTKRAMSQLLRRPKNKALRELMTTLLGASAGATAADTVTRVAAHDPDNVDTLGGVRSIETVTNVNHATTAADVTDINDKMFSPNNSVFVADKSGNGGGGKLGF